MLPLFAAITLLLPVQSAASQPESKAAHTTAGPEMARAAATSTITLEAPADSVFPLFGPAREGEWAAGWNPRMLYPQSGQGPDGAVFTTPGKGGESVWVMTTYDPAGRRVEYVRFEPNWAVTELTVQVSPASEHTCTAVVRHRLTALVPKADLWVSQLRQNLAQLTDHWQEAINYYLRTGRAMPHSEASRH